MNADRIERLVVFGATGDLVGRHLLPALAELQQAGELPDRFEVVGLARRDLDDAGFRAIATERLDQHAADVSPAARAAVVDKVRYRQVDLTDPASVAAALGDDQRPLVAYLALPPSTFPTVVVTLGQVGLPPGSRIVLEKPFGEDLASAMDLNLLVEDVGGEDAIFRVDHVLGLPTLHNLLGARLANRVLEPLWNSTHIEQVDILWEETIALEGRSGYYDGVGALEDVIQNHLLQIMSLVAMEPPVAIAAAELRDRKVELLRSVRVPSPAEAAELTTRAQYTAGTLAPPPDGAGTDVPAYVDEDGVNRSLDTETFAEIVLTVDNPRWSGTRFVLRAGKALDQRRKGVIIRFRPVATLPFGPDGVEPPRNELLIGLDGPESFTLSLTGSVPGPPAALAPLNLSADLPSDELPAYSHVLLNVLDGDRTLSVRGDEAVLAWQIVTPFIDAWASGDVPMLEYAAGSAGPPGRIGLRSLRPR